MVEHSIVISSNADELSRDSLLNQADRREAPLSSDETEALEFFRSVICEMSTEASMPLRRIL
jgi:hypothetical protein